MQLFLTALESVPDPRAENSRHDLIEILLIGLTNERDQLAARNAKLEHILAEIRRAHFGRKSERISDDQLALALEDLEAAHANDEAKDEKVDPALKLMRAHKRSTSRVDE
jgi:transposase